MGDTNRDPWARFQPNTERPWDRRLAAHLLRRAGFGGTAADVEESVRRGMEDTVRWLLGVPPPEEGFGRTLRDAVRDLAVQDEVEDLRARWIHRMVHTPYPLQEKMTLFWHGHFATSIEKVVDPGLMQAQNDTLRRNAVGRFGDMLGAISRDPAMIVWLDGEVNRRGRPNENYARELMELFTMGVGHYSENDVKEVARAFTGWHRRGGEFFFDESAHDPGTKRILGRTGRFGGDDAIRILLEEDATAEFLAGKLFRFFVHPDPDPATLAPLAARLRESGYDIRGTFGTILASEVFYSEAAYKSLIKSPAEFVIGGIQALGVRARPIALARAMARMGQNLYAPPNVAGWEGGRAWVSATTVLARSDAALELSKARGQDVGNYFDPSLLFGDAAGPEALADRALEILVQGEVPDSTRESIVEFALTLEPGARIPPRAWRANLDDKARGVVHLALSLPEYNLC
ncbi:MAG: DUF1800 domain-containing protein [Planctomycetes bacterium]|nr:DUF1800 domain-containing protein [Planctomycetota bacterium]